MKNKFIQIVEQHKTFIIFFIVAVTTIVIELSAYTFLFYILKVDPVVSSPIGQIVGLIVNFTLNKTFTFKSEIKMPVREFFKYFLVWIINLIISTILIYILTSIFAIFPTILRLCVIATMFFFNYFALKYFVFKKNV